MEGSGPAMNAGKGLGSLSAIIYIKPTVSVHKLFIEKLVPILCFGFLILSLHVDDI